MNVPTRWALLCTAAILFALALPAPLSAAEDGYSLMVGFPASFTFSKDENTQESPPATSPSGIRVMLNTPVNLGVGFGSYTAGFEQTEWPWVGREIHYSFLEFLFTIPANVMRFGIGFGLGSAEFTPKKAEYPPLPIISQEWEKSPAQEWILMVGAKLSEYIGVHLAVHAMTIDVQIQTFPGGQESSGDLGAVMSTINGSYYF